MTWFLITVLALLILVVAGLVLFTGSTARKIEKALPPRGRFTEIDGQRIHYLDKGQGPPIVIVHGLAGQMGHFTHSLLDRLTDEYRVILIDRPGSGYSTRPRGAAARLRAQGDVVAKFIRSLKLDRPLLVGHSLGGAVSLAVGLDHPETIGALALIAPLTQVEEHPPAVFKGLVVRSDTARRAVAWTVATPLAIRNREAVLDTVFGPDPVPADFATAGGGLLGLRPSGYYSASTDLVSIPDDLPGMVTRYPSLKVPVSILFGTGDRILDHRRHGVAMKERVSGVDLKLVPGGHMLPLTAPDETAAWIKSKARSLAAGAALAQDQA